MFKVHYRNMTRICSRKVSLVREQMKRAKENNEIHQPNIICGFRLDPYSNKQLFKKKL